MRFFDCADVQDVEAGHTYLHARSKFMSDAVTLVWHGLVKLNAGGVGFKQTQLVQPSRMRGIVKFAFGFLPVPAGFKTDHMHCTAINPCEPAR